MSWITKPFLWGAKPEEPTVPPPPPKISPEYQIIINDLEKNWDKWEFDSTDKSMYISFVAKRVVDGLQLSLGVFTSGSHVMYIYLHEPKTDIHMVTGEDGNVLGKKLMEAQEKKMRPIWDEAVKKEKEKREKAIQDFNTIIEKLK
jgi:hypothetical protein